MHFRVPCLSFLWGYLSFHKQTHERLIPVSLTLKEETKPLGTPFFTAQLYTPFFLRTLKTSKKMRCLGNFDLLPFNPKSRVTFWDRVLGWDWPTWKGEQSQTMPTKGFWEMSGDVWDRRVCHSPEVSTSEIGFKSVFFFFKYMANRMSGDHFIQCFVRLAP